MSRPWYAAGIRFECTRCHACCMARGEYVFVYLEHDDLLAMAAELELEPADFRRRYCTQDRGDLCLRFESVECPLHDGEGCLTYHSRPVQCRTWPFWPDNLQSRKAWEENVVSCCPGAGRGPVVPRKEIDRIAGEMTE